MAKISKNLAANTSPLNVGGKDILNVHLDIWRNTTKLLVNYKRLVLSPNTSLLTMDDTDKIVNVHLDIWGILPNILVMIGNILRLV